MKREKYLKDSLFLNFFDILCYRPSRWRQKFAVEVTKLMSPDEIRRFDGTIQYCFIYRPSDSTVSEDAGIEPRMKKSYTAAEPTFHWNLLHMSRILYCEFHWAWVVVYKSPFLAIVQEHCWKDDIPVTFLPKFKDPPHVFKDHNSIPKLPFKNLF